MPPHRARAPLGFDDLLAARARARDACAGLGARRSRAVPARGVLDRATGRLAGPAAPARTSWPLAPLLVVLPSEATVGADRWLPVPGGSSSGISAGGVDPERTASAGCRRRDR